MLTYSSSEIIIWNEQNISPLAIKAVQNGRKNRIVIILTDAVIAFWSQSAGRKLLHKNV